MRKEGYYWVKTARCTEWSIAFYYVRHGLGEWHSVAISNSPTFDEKIFTEISERITPPDENKGL